jgi:hypothetical protein
VIFGFIAGKSSCRRMRSSQAVVAKLAVEPSRPCAETSDFASLPRDRFALIQLTYVRRTIGRTPRRAEKDRTDVQFDSDVATALEHRDGTGRLRRCYRLRMRTAGAIWVAAATLALFAPPASATPPSGRSHCNARELRATLVSFAAAFDRSNLQVLDSLFAEKPDFQWYATDGRIGQAAKRRDTLIPYFRARHARGEKLGLKHFRFTGNSPHYGNFEMTMRRRIPGVRHSRWQPVPGKGAAVCREGTTRLIVMSLGTVPGR